MLTETIAIRKLEFEPSADCLNNTIFIKDLDLTIDFGSDWLVSPDERFNEFMNDYIFPAEEDLSKKDRENYKNAIFPPLKIIEKREKKGGTFSPVMVIYLYERKALTGPSNLHIRSINKFEMMWAPYLIDASGPYRTNPKVFKICGYPASLSQIMNFIYKSKDYPDGINSRLRTLTIDLAPYVLAFYLIDNTESFVDDIEVKSLIEGIKTKEAEPNPSSCCATH
ncbi:hypothetical protein [Nafulsella turpanensis]|uniref:hypothetical protein n=1 Tax=Nafulsella turpanensis TaxID=1265690 RepID=UPI0003482ED4|nr:hypothetical protein [Nafulsella turpanensis]